MSMKSLGVFLMGMMLVSQTSFAQQISKKSKLKSSAMLDVLDMNEQQMKRLQEICGNNLACYFSTEEVVEAFGGRMAAELGLAELLPMEDSQRYAAEDENNYAEVMAAEERAKARKAQAQLEEMANAASQFLGDLPPRQKTAENKVEVKKSEEKKEAKKTAAKKESGPLKFSGIQARGYPIYASFVSKFRECAPGCFPHAVSVHRPGARSCHATGRAIDIGAIICGGKRYEAIAEASRAGKFTEFKNCMIRKKMKTLWHNERYSKATITSGHWDHAHFSNGCTLADGTRYY